MEELTITLDWSRVKSEVNKHFSFIGKRLKNKDGTTQFAKITLSSEEKNIMQQYINAAAETFAAEMAPLVTYYDNGDFLVFKVKNTRWADNENGLSVPFESNFMGYTVAYVANAVLGMNYPELAKKYSEDMVNHLNAAIRLVYIKKPPTASGKKWTSMEGEMYDDKGKLFTGN